MKDYYFPRTQEAELILRSIQSNDSFNFTLFKIRRAGKTSFLKKDIVELAKERKDVFCFYHSFFGEVNTVLNVFKKNFILELAKNSTMTQKTKSFLSFIKKIGLGLSFDGGFEVNLVIDAIHKENLNFSNFEIDELFKSFNENFPEKKLFLLLDEFQEIAKADDGIWFARSLRTAIDANHSFVKAIFTGSSYSGLMSFFKDYSNPFYNFGGQYNLEDLDEEFLKHILSVCFNNTGDMELKMETLSKWFEKTGNSPFYVTETLKTIQMIPVKKNVNRNELFEKEVNKLIFLDADLFEKELNYKSKWQSLNELEQFLVFLSIREQKPFNEKGMVWIAEKQNIETSKIKNRLSYALKGLVKKLILEKDNGKYKLGDLSFREYLLRTNELERFYGFF